MLAKFSASFAMSSPGPSSASAPPAAGSETSLRLLELRETPSRKRKRNVAMWEKSKRKCLRNSGQEYMNVSKQKVSDSLVVIVY